MLRQWMCTWNVHVYKFYLLTYLLAHTWDEKLDVKMAVWFTRLCTQTLQKVKCFSFPKLILIFNSNTAWTYVAVLCLTFVVFVYRDSLLGSLTKTLQKRIGTAGMSPSSNRDDHEDSEFDTRKVQFCDSTELELLKITATCSLLCFIGVKNMDVNVL